MPNKQISKLLRDPLIHFLIIGVGVFVLLDWFRPDTQSDSSKTLNIRDSDLLGFMQYREQNFDVEFYQRKLANLSSAEHKQLVSEFAEQEVLHREALRLGLDQGDPTIKRRTIQRMKYMLENFSAEVEPLSRKQIEKYFIAHQEDYRNPATISFSHLFYSADISKNTIPGRDGWEAAEIRARDARRQIKQESTASSDHFPYHFNYADKTEEQIARHFGKEFAEQLFSNVTSEPLTEEEEFREGFKSAYGYHLVSIKKYTPAFTAEFTSIFERIEKDANTAAYREAQRAAVKSLVDQYQVNLIKG